VLSTTQHTTTKHTPALGVYCWQLDHRELSASYNQVVPTYVPRQRSNQRLPVTVDIVDDLGQQISGQHPRQLAAHSSVVSYDDAGHLIMT
jgi:hypothetical protein